MTWLSSTGGRRHRAHLLDLLLRALHRSVDDRGGPADRGRGDRPRGPDRRFRAAPRFNRAIRPAWFFELAKFGGILNDIASHQIDQFLRFTGSQDGRIVASSTGNFGTPDFPDFQDFGDILLESDGAAGYVRVIGSRPTGCRPGAMAASPFSARKERSSSQILDIAGRPGTDHVFPGRPDRDPPHRREP
jgi:predicted dehydrogenase